MNEIDHGDEHASSPSVSVGVAPVSNLELQIGFLLRRNRGLLCAAVMQKSHGLSHWLFTFLG
jgi:hypothetical protein